MKDLLRLKDCGDYKQKEVMFVNENQGASVGE